MMTAAIVLICVGVVALLLYAIIRTITRNPVFAVQHTLKMVEYLKESASRERTTTERDVTQVIITTRLEKLLHEQRTAVDKLSAADREESGRLAEEIIRLASEINCHLALVLSTRSEAARSAKAARKLLHASNAFEAMLVDKASDSSPQDAASLQERIQSSIKFEKQLGDEPLAVLLLAIVNLSGFGGDERMAEAMRRSDAILATLKKHMRADAPIESVPAALRSMRAATKRTTRAVRWATVFPSQPAIDSFVGRSEELLTEIERFVKEMY